jgi:small GTP-binding protein
MTRQPAPSAPLRLAVVGHTNVGKTSLLRTLTRRVDFGEVSSRPGTTRHVEAVTLRVEGRDAVRFLDTPGLEDAVALLAHVGTLAGDTRIARIRSFLAGPEARGSFEQEAKVLRALEGEADAAFVVIDTREPVLPKYRAEIELLAACGRPLMPVLNFVRDPASREEPWRSMLAESGLHAVVCFDAAAPFTGAERDLYTDLGTLLPQRREELRAVIAHLERDADERRAEACRLIAAQLVDCAALRNTVEAAEWADPVRRQRAMERLREQARARAQRGVDALLSLHGFRMGDAAEAPLPALQGRDSADLFNPELLKRAGLQLGGGAAVGAALGVAADLAVGGASLGAGAALGGTLGGLLSQGWGPFGRRVMGLLSGQHDLSVEDEALYVMAQQQLRLVHELERRGHGAAAPPVAVANAADGRDDPQARFVAQAVAATRAARAHPEWARQGGLRDRLAGPPGEYADAVNEVAHALQGAASALAARPT